MINTTVLMDCIMERDAPYFSHLERSQPFGQWPTNTLLKEREENKRKPEHFAKICKPWNFLCITILVYPIFGFNHQTMKVDTKII